MAAGVTGVKKLTRLPSGARNSSDRLPQGIVVGSLTKSVTKPVTVAVARSVYSHLPPVRHPAVARFQGCRQCRPSSPSSPGPGGHRYSCVSRRHCRSTVRWPAGVAEFGAAQAVSGHDGHGRGEGQHRYLGREVLQEQAAAGDAGGHAQHLGEPQTKLYRHVKQLEAAGLIEVAATRMVSGILEQRYRARQRDLRLSAALFRRHADETEAAIRSAFDAFLTGLADRARKEDWPPDAPDKPVMHVSRDRVSPEAAERIRARLAEAIREIAEAEAGDIPVSVAIGFYRPAT